VSLATKATRKLSIQGLPLYNHPPKSFTLQHNHTVNVLITEATIHPAFDPEKVKSVPPGKPFNAIWDTGATNTVITKKVVDQCGLKPIGMTQVHTAGGIKKCLIYLVGIMLPNGVGITKVQVTEATLTDHADILIGMDIISLGDFAITNFHGQTVLTFRLPSSERIDFVHQPQTINTSEAIKPARNTRCPCGSGKKYKNCCHLKNL